MVGVAGVLAFSVSQRTNELGIRMALGAEPRGILRMILGEGAMMSAIGLVIGGRDVAAVRGDGGGMGTRRAGR